MSDLRERIRRWRLARSKEESLPAYCVVDNKTLELIAEARPQSERALLRIKGIGPKKVDKYGAALLGLCRGSGGGGGGGGGSSSKRAAPARTSGSNESQPPSTRPRFTVGPALARSSSSSSRSYASSSSSSSSLAAAAAASSASAPPSDGVLNEVQALVLQDALRGGNLFVTGEAGTGKSFLFRRIRAELVKRHGEAGVAVVAPTGIAAINVGGTTLHSWSGIGLGRGSVEKLKAKVRASAKAANNWRSARVLMIDEVSMLDSELFDKLAQIGADVRDVPTPFGGLQVIVFGDFFQLPPVQLTAFAFDARAWSDLGLSSTSLASGNGVRVLTENVRQRGDVAFIAALNELRVGRCSDRTQAILARCNVTRKALPTDGILPTKLHCTNRSVDEVNVGELDRLPGREVSIGAHDEFAGAAAEAGSKAREQVAAAADKKIASVLRLKVGAQVVLLRNLSPSLVNGRRGVVVGFDERQGRPEVLFDNGEVLAVGPSEFWQGCGGAGSVSRRQIPLKLAWALTVHKAQGMTLSRVELCLQNAFESGQAYVALSRATSLEGLWVRGRDISQREVMAHPSVVRFYERVTGSTAARSQAACQAPYEVLEAPRVAGMTGWPGGGGGGASAQAAARRSQAAAFNFIDLS